MSKFFANLYAVLGVGLVLLAILIGVAPGNSELAVAITHWLHLFFGVVWIGLLYYFNFVQIPTMPKVPAELKPAVSKFIAPSALFYFRWAAVGTVVTGLLVAWVMGYVHEAMTLSAGYQLIGIGMWLALIMAFNVWFVIWPNQQKALNIGGKYPDLAADQKAAAAIVGAMEAGTVDVLPPHLFDVVLSNFVLDADDTLQFIDAEWHIEGGVDLRTVAARALCRFAFQLVVSGRTLPWPATATADEIAQTLGHSVGLAFGGEESAGASFLRLDGTAWTTDKDGILLALLASEILAVTGKTPSQLYAELVAEFGDPAYERVDAAASPEQKARLGKLSGAAITATELAVSDPTNAGPATVKATGRVCYASANRAVTALEHLTRYARFRGV